MITIIGSLNMDLVVEAPRLPVPGETILGNGFRKSPGGKGGNQACATARMGAKVTLIGAVGNDAFGRELLASLAADGVDVTAVRIRQESPTGTAFIIVDPAGENQIVVAGGANATLDTATIARCESLIRRSRMVIAQLETPLPAFEDAFRLARAAGVVTLLNPAPARVLGTDLLALCDWIVANEIEARTLLGEANDGSFTPAAIARHLRHRSPRTQVLITLGRHGAWLESDSCSAHLPAFLVEAVDTVGAGDTFVGAFAAALMEGAAPESAGRLAAAAAAISVTRRGAQESIPRRAEADFMIAKHG